MPRRPGQADGIPLRHRLALHRFVCHEFGYLGGMFDMLDFLRDLPAGFDPSGESEYVKALVVHRHRSRVQVPPEQFAEYDANIAALSHALRMTGEHGRTWKPHQYLALLFTEHYLNRYFADPESLRVDLNEAETPAPADEVDAGLHPGRPSHRRLPERDRLRQDAHHARSHPPVPALASASGRAAQQRHPADPERADVGAARARAPGERPPRPHLLERRRGGPLCPRRDHRPQQAGGEERRQARRGAGLREEQPGAGGRGAPRRIRQRMARTARGAGAGRLRLRVLRDLQPDRGQG